MEIVETNQKLNWSGIAKFRANNYRYPIVQVQSHLNDLFIRYSGGELRSSGIVFKLNDFRLHSPCTISLYFLSEGGQIIPTHLNDALFSFYKKEGLSLGYINT